MVMMMFCSMRIFYSMLVNDTRFDDVRRIYVYDYLADVDEDSAPAEHMIADNDLYHTGKLMEYRNRSVELAKKEENLRDNRVPSQRCLHQSRATSFVFAPISANVS